MSRNLRIAVTGGSGNIGQALCEALVAQGHEVFNLDRRHPRRPAGKFIYCDLRKREFVQPIFDQVDAVCLLGEIPHARAMAPEEVYSTNTAIGSVVLQTAADLKIKRIIYTSSCQAYGQWDTPFVNPPTFPFDEARPLDPQNNYALSKAANEGYARMLAKQNPELSIAIFRFPWVVFEPHLRPRWMGELIFDPHERVDGFGTYLHITDAVRAYQLALENPRPGCEAYHFTAAKVRLARPLREVMAQFHPDIPPLPKDWPDLKSPVILDKAKAHFGWEPRWDALEYQASLAAKKTQNSQ